MQKPIAQRLLSDPEGEESAGLNTYLTFQFGDVVYAVEVVNVREILDFQTVTPLPNTSADILGVIDLRGQSIGIIDLAGRLGIHLTEIETARIIVFELPDGDDTTLIGVLADKVLSVDEIPPEDIEGPPSTMSNWNPDTMRGVGRINGRLVIVLRLQNIFQQHDWSKQTAFA